MHEAANSGVEAEVIRLPSPAQSGGRKVGVDRVIRLDASRPACTVIGYLSDRNRNILSTAHVPRPQKTEKRSDPVEKKHMGLGRGWVTAN